MKVAFVTIGSRGDVQPILLLAKGCQDAGLSVVLVTHSNMLPWAHSFNIPTKPIKMNIEDLSHRPELAEAIAKGDTNKYSKMILQDKEVTNDIFSDIYEGCHGVDFIVTSGTTVFMVIHVAEKKKIGFCVVSISPMHMTGDFLPLGLGDLGIKRLNRLAHSMARMAMWSTASDTIHKWRSNLGLAKMSSLEFHQTIYDAQWFYAFSDLIIRKPSDWTDNCSVGGFIFMTSAPGTKLAGALEKFIDQAKGEVIYVGFGSMPAHLTKKFHVIVDELIEHSSENTHFIIYVGSNSSSENSVNNFTKWTQSGKSFVLSGSAPHDVLFPRCKIIIHHGGAGTTAASLRAGRPQIICSFFADQPMWAKRMSSLGVAPKVPLKFAHVNSKSILAAIQEVSHETYIKKAAEIGDAIRVENGLKIAVEWVKKNADMKKIKK